jgi:hypothetical protein
MSLAFAAVSCAAKPVTLGETQIGQGKLYQSGSVAYDRFFQDTHAVQLEVMRADEDEAQARAPLEKVLDARGASLEKLYDLVMTRAKKAGEDSPPILYVTVVGLDTNKEEAPKEAPTDPAKDPSDSDGETPKDGAKEGAKEGPRETKGEAPKRIATAVAPMDAASFPADQKPFLKALGETVKSEAEILDRFGPIAVKASQLSTYSDELADGVDKEFSTRKLRKDVSQELGAAKLILNATEERARDVATRARTFLKALSDGLKPPPEAPPPPLPTPVEKPTKPTRTRRGGGSVAPVKPAKPVDSPAVPKSEDKPAKPAKPAEDFNP